MNARRAIRKIYHRKLIRDRIPGVMRSKGKQFSLRTLSLRAFERELLKKLQEEAREVLLARTKTELIAELADVMDVIDAICRMKRIQKRQIEKKQEEHANKKGGFTKKQFLVWSEDDGYKNHPKG